MKNELSATKIINQTKAVDPEYFFMQLFFLQNLKPKYQGAVLLHHSFLLKPFKLIAIQPAALNDEFDFDDAFKKNLEEYREAFGTNIYLAATRRYYGDDQKQLFRLSELSKQFNVPIIATNDVYYHDPSRR